MRMKACTVLKTYAGRLNFWLLAIYFALFGFFLIGMPKYIDDYWFMEFLRPWFDAQGIADPDGGGNIFKAGIPWREIAATWWHHYEYDNIRLANIMVVIFLMFPKWLGSGVALVAWMYAVVRGFGLAGLDWSRSPLLPVALALYYVLMPWSDSFGSMDYQFNYLVPAAGAVWLLMRVSRRRTGLVWWTGTVVLGILVGWWHEGVGVPLACGLVALLIFRPYRTPGVLITALAIFATVFTVLSGPGMGERVEGEASLVWPLPAWLISEFVRIEWVFVVDLLLMGVLLLKGGLKSLLTPRTVVPAAICLASVAIMYVISVKPRVGWMCAEFSIVLFTVLLPMALPCMRGYNMANRIVGLVLIGCVCAMMTVTDVEVVRLRKVGKEVVAKVSGDRSLRYVFAPLKYMSEQSPLQLMMPTRMWGSTGQMYLCRYFTGDRGTARMYIVPEELESVTAESGESVPGSGGWRRYKGKYFRPVSGLEYTTFSRKVQLDFGKGYVDAFCMASVFRSSADGRDYIFIEPELSWYLTHFKTVKAIGELKIYEII